MLARHSFRKGAAADVAMAHEHQSPDALLARLKYRSKARYDFGIRKSEPYGPAKRTETLVPHSFTHTARWPAAAHPSATWCVRGCEQAGTAYHACLRLRPDR